MIAFALLLDVVPGINVTREDWTEISSRFECSVVPAGTSELESVVFLFPKDQQPGEPQAWVFETYRGGFSALSRTSASSLPAPPSEPRGIPVFRPIITFGESVFETLTATNAMGDRWTYKRIDAAGGDKPVVTRGECKLVVDNVG